ncbi:30S ribosomal protein S5 [Patescibacteria group bacterium]|nr:30S ribosomal protein S5 [Patescibacteria group bacterium]
MEKREFRNSRRFSAREPDEFDQKIIDLARVTRVMAGGKRMRFRACVAIGNKKGQFGIGLAKGADVTLAVAKAVNKAKKNLITIPLVKETIPHEVRMKFKAAKLLLKPAPIGTGVKAGGAVRVVLELAGVQNIVGKILGSNSKINNVKALAIALSSFKQAKFAEKKFNSKSVATGVKDEQKQPEKKEEKAK